GRRRFGGGVDVVGAGDRGALRRVRARADGGHPAYRHRRGGGRPGRQGGGDEEHHLRGRAPTRDGVADRPPALDRRGLVLVQRRVRGGATGVRLPARQVGRGDPKGE